MEANRRCDQGEHAVEGSRPVILVVDDEAHIRESVEKALEKEGYEVMQAATGQEALEVLRQRLVSLALCDLRMPVMDGMQFLKLSRTMRPETEVVMMTGYGTVETAVEAIKLGAYDFIEKPFKRLQLVKTIQKALEKQSLLFENTRLREELDGETAGPRTIIGASPAMRQVIELVNQVADSAATILIDGESGTGKEVFANAIHFRSHRRSRPYIKVSCAALPETLLEAELFGYERGAFTGAVGRKSGRFELADTGTLFMDEVGEIPASMQVKLLRVLQEGEFERLGGTRTQRVDVRLVAATNRNLTDLVKRGRFREDLFYRLNVINIVIPPLRDRREDIPLLVDHFIQRYSRRNHRPIAGITREAMDRLMAYAWPGNVRELENTIERAIVLTRDSTIGVEALPPAIIATPASSSYVMVPIGMKLQDVERKLIDETLKHADGNRELAAKLLGIASRTIYRKLGPREPGAADESADEPGEEPPGAAVPDPTAAPG
jgi:two-component system, NtrC family, response regulator HydG